MPLSAVVMCNCFREGKTSPLALPVDLLVFEEGYVRLDLPVSNHEQEHRLFHAWLESCCPHPGFRRFNEYIQNWWGYRNFQQALERLGWQHFPVLKAELPETNDGLMSAASAAKALLELQYFKQHISDVKNWFLVNSETGEVVHEYVACYGGIWSVTQGMYNVSFDPQGFFVFTNTNPPREVFRAMRFEQILPDPKLIEAGQSEEVEYVDLDTGQRFLCSMPIGDILWQEGTLKLVAPRYAHVEERNLSVANFSRILSSLTEALTASIETGNPIYWR